MSETSRPLIVGLLPLALLAAGCDRGSSEAVQANAANASAPALSPDEVAPAGPAAAAGVVRPDFSHQGEAAPADAFADAAGKPVTLAGFRGKPLLVNLWATWCAPCIAEMPTLDTLAKREAGRLNVVAISQDLDPAQAKKFWAQRKLASLALYTDAATKLSVAYGANLPTTILYGADGKERWRVTGGMDWAGAEAAKLMALAD